MPDDPLVEITVTANMENLDRIIKAVTGLADKLGYDDGIVRKIKLAVDEAVVNVISYAYPDGAGRMTVKAGLSEENGFVVEIQDEGHPFDVLSLPEPDIKCDVTERRIGGLGVHFIKKMADAVRYRRSKNKNILTIKFKDEKPLK